MIKLLLVCTFIIVLLMLRKSLWLVMFAATLFLGVIFLMPPLVFIKTVLLSLTSATTIQITAVMILIMFLEFILDKNGYLDKTLAAMSGLFNNRRINIAAMPALVGLLPSAGGALFSAPFVEKVAADYLTGPDKAFINNYYRHIMELFLPTYPSVLLAVSLTGVPLANYVLLMLLIAAFQAALGVYYLRKVPKELDCDRPASRLKEAKVLLLSLWPFLLMLFLILAVKLPVYLAVGLTLLVSLFVTRSGKADLKAMIKERLNWRIILILVAVLVFKDLLSASGALDRLPQAIAAVPIAPYLVFGLSAYFISLLTGILITGLAITIPLALAAIPGSGVPLAMLLSVFAYAGAMMSPMHLCLVVSCEYFSSDIRTQIIKSLPPYALICLITTALYLLLV